MPPRTNVATRARVRAMTEQGLTARQIAVALNLSTQRIYALWKGMGITPPSKRTTDNGGTAA